MEVDSFTPTECVLYKYNSIINTCIKATGIQVILLFLTLSSISMSKAPNQKSNKKLHLYLLQTSTFLSSHCKSIECLSCARYDTLFSQAYREFTMFTTRTFLLS